MSLKSSISLRDDQYAFAKTLVAGGRFASVSAVVQQGLDLLRQQEADGTMDRAALLALLAERAAGAFVSAQTLRAGATRHRAILSQSTLASGNLTRGTSSFRRRRRPCE
jgi:antitoxin ParD1/3/4